MLQWMDRVDKGMAKILAHIQSSQVVRDGTMHISCNYSFCLCYIQAWYKCLGIWLRVRLHDVRCPCDLYHKTYSLKLGGPLLQTPSTVKEGPSSSGGDCTVSGSFLSQILTLYPMNFMITLRCIGSKLCVVLPYSIRSMA